jgi:uncharacterized protein (UPF0335 family)
MAKAAKKQAEAEERDDAPGIGHNSGNRLKSFIERIERLEEEKKAIAEDVRDVYGEAKATGFDPAIMRIIVRQRKMNLEKRREQEELVETYKSAIGMAE